MPLVKPTLDQCSFGDENFRAKNLLINGNFDVWRRGVSRSVTSPYGDFPAADKWGLWNEGVGGTCDISQEAFTLGQTDVPNNPKYFIRHDVTTGGTSLDAVIIDQPIEDVTLLAGQTVTLSFWAKTSVALDIAIEIKQHFGTGGSPSANVETQIDKVSCTTSWTKYELTFAVPSISGKVLGTDENTSGLGLLFWLSSGSNYNSRNFSLGTQSGVFDIAQVQLEKGTRASTFEYKTYHEEFRDCMRYCQIRAYGANNTIGINWAPTSTYVEGAYIQLHVPMKLIYPLASANFVSDLATLADYTGLGVARNSQGTQNILGDIGFWVNRYTLLAGGIYNVTGLTAGLPYVIQTTSGTPHLIIVTDKMI